MENKNQFLQPSAKEPNAEEGHREYPENFFRDNLSNTVTEKLSEAELLENKRIDRYGRFLNLATIDGISGATWGDAVRRWRSGELEGNMAPDLKEPPEGLKEFIESKGYSFETGEKLLKSE